VLLDVTESFGSTLTAWARLGTDTATARMSETALILCILVLPGVRKVLRIEKISSKVVKLLQLLCDKRENIIDNLVRTGTITYRRSKVAFGHNGSQREAPLTT
jgi:hypothetical protein